MKEKNINTWEPLLLFSWLFIVVLDSTHHEMDFKKRKKGEKNPFIKWSDPLCDFFPLGILSYIAFVMS